MKRVHKNMKQYLQFLTGQARYLVTSKMSRNYVKKGSKYSEAEVN